MSSSANRDRRRASWICWAFCALLLGIEGARWALADYPLAGELRALAASGYGALAALFFSLAMTPVGRVLARFGVGGASRGLLGALRRSAGITAAALGLLHAGIGLFTYLRGSWPVVVSRPDLRAGLACLAVLTVLLATSFPGLFARAGLRYWKPLHRLAYPAALLLFLHLFLSPFAPRARVLVLFASLLAVQALRLIPVGRRRSRP